jgi:Icc-related predicted phosphoesterase
LVIRILCITDIHGDRHAYRRIIDREAPGVDVIAIGGDITNFGTPEDAEWFIDQAVATGKMTVAVAGNCDSAQIDRYLVERGVSVAGFGKLIGRVGIYGVSAAPLWHGTMYELTEDELKIYLQHGREQLGGVDTEVILSHSPPRQTAVDRVRSGAHVGSSSLRELIEQTQPALVICGHIHEARGIDQVGKSVVVNCGPAFQGYYAVATIGDHGLARVDLRAVK